MQAPKHIPNEMAYCHDVLNALPEFNDINLKYLALEYLYSQQLVIAHDRKIEVRNPETLELTYTYELSQDVEGVIRRVAILDDLIIFFLKVGQLSGKYDLYSYNSTSEKLFLITQLITEKYYDPTPMLYVYQHKLYYINNKNLHSWSPTQEIVNLKIKPIYRFYPFANWFYTLEYDTITKYDWNYSTLKSSQLSDQCLLVTENKIYLSDDVSILVLDSDFLLINRVPIERVEKIAEWNNDLVIVIGGEKYIPDDDENPTEQIFLYDTNFHYIQTLADVGRDNYTESTVIGENLFFLEMWYKLFKFRYVKGTLFKYGLSAIEHDFNSISHT